jgi:hypothetical protein
VFHKLALGRARLLQLAEKWDVFLVPSFRELFFCALSRPDFVLSGHFFDR